MEKNGSQRVSDFINKDFVNLDENMLIGEAAKIMYERDACSIIVTRNDNMKRLRRPIGIITARDVLHRVVAQNKGPFKVTLKDVMSTPIITINKDAPAEDAILLMRSKNITRLPVVNDGGEMLGVTSLKSIVNSAKIQNVDDISVM